jgi:fatty acid-binding protein DegV
MESSFIGIIAGEDIDMPGDFISKNNIQIYTYNILWEGVLQNRSDIYKKMRQNRDDNQAGSPQTSQPSVGMFKELIESGLKKFDEVFLVTLSSKLSGSFSSAQQAVAMLEKDQQAKVHLVESPSSSVGSAFMVK